MKPNNLYDLKHRPLHQYDKKSRKKEGSNHPNRGELGTLPWGHMKFRLKPSITITKFAHSLSGNIDPVKGAQKNYNFYEISAKYLL